MNGILRCLYRKIFCFFVVYSVLFTVLLSKFVINSSRIGLFQAPMLPQNEFLRFLKSQLFFTFLNFCCVNPLLRSSARVGRSFFGNFFSKYSKNSQKMEKTVFSVQRLNMNKNKMCLRKIPVDPVFCCLFLHFFI